MPRDTDIKKMLDQGFDPDEIEQSLTEQEQRDHRERKQRRQEKQTWKRRKQSPKEED